MRLRSRGPVAVVALSGGATIVGSLPGLMAGALAPRLSEALVFSVAGLGTAFALSSGVSALFSARIGRTVDRLGAPRAIRLSMLLSGAVALLVAAVARDFRTLVVLLVLGTLGTRILEPAANRFLVEEVGQRRLGLAFGLKQSAPPVAAVIAGLSVSLPDWRLAYGLAALLALSVALAIWPRERRSIAHLSRSDETATASAESANGGDDRRTIVILTLAFGFAHASFPAILQFYVTGAVAAGTAPGTAGRVLAIASGLAVVTRLSLGLVSDRLVDGHLQLCAAMLGAGAFGFALLASQTPVLAEIGVVIGLGTAWGFNGLFWFAVVRSNASDAGSVSGRIAPGALIALTVSPLVFSQIAENLGFRAGWLFSASMAALAALGMLLAHRSRRTAGTRSSDDPRG